MVSRVKTFSISENAAVLIIHSNASSENAVRSFWPIPEGVMRAPITRFVSTVARGVLCVPFILFAPNVFNGTCDICHDFLRAKLRIAGLDLPGNLDKAAAGVLSERLILVWAHDNRVGFALFLDGHDFPSEF